MKSTGRRRLMLTFAFGMASVRSPVICPRCGQPEPDVMAERVGVGRGVASVKLREHPDLSPTFGRNIP